MPPEKPVLTIGDHVEASFRLLDVVPFAVRYDISQLIYKYMADSGGYMEWRKTLNFNAKTMPGEKAETGGLGQ